ncbi:MAG: hypothetical protein R3D32_12785 [Nitratireductor sp.]
MDDWELFAFVIACGFTASGLLAEIHKLATTSSPSFTLYFNSPLSIIWSVIVCMFAGPYLVLARGWYFFTSGQLRISGLGLLAGLSAIWSFCSGVFVVELLILIDVVRI